MQLAVIALNPVNKRPTGTGFVTFNTPIGLQKCLKRAEVIFEGRLVQLKQAQTNEDQMDQKMPEYVKRAFDRNNILAWNAMKQNQQNITSAVAERLGMDEADLRNNAVALAAGEALLNKELKEAMTAVGISETGTRSKTAILVKNLSADVTEDQIKQLFAQYGPLQQCKLFYTGFCLVQFTQPSDARRAFAKQAFRKLGKEYQPMMLEWAVLADSSQPNAETAQKPETDEKQTT